MKIGIECFAGCNTSLGFFSGFESLFTDTVKTFFIKGAPGTGKSSLMKRIAERQKALGHTVSLFHCSSDPDSLDGVIDETIRASIFDATSPHTYDPPYPGATGTILSLGDSLNEGALYADRSEIENLNRQIKAEFAASAHFLSAVSGIQSAYASAPDPVQAEKFALSLLPDALPGKKLGRERTYFLSAVTYKGETRFPLPFSKEMTVRVASASRNMKSEALFRLKNRARLSGKETVLFLSPVNPGLAEHLYLPDDGIFVTGDESIPADRTYELAARARKAPAETAQAVSALMKSAQSALQSAKSLHDLLEERYIPRMDFSHLVECESRVTEAFDKIEAEL